MPLGIEFIYLLYIYINIYIFIYYKMIYDFEKKIKREVSWKKIKLNKVNRMCFVFLSYKKQIKLVKISFLIDYSIFFS